MSESGNDKALAGVSGVGQNSTGAVVPLEEIKPWLKKMPVVWRMPCGCHREEADRVFRQLTDKTVMVERHSTGRHLRCGTKEHRRCGPTSRDKAAAEEDAHRVAD